MKNSPSVAGKPDAPRANTPVLAAPVLVLVVMGLSLMLNFIDTSVLGEGETVFLSVALMQLLIIFLPALFYMRLRNIPISRLRLRLPGVRNVRFLVAAVLTVVFGGMLLSFLMFALGVPVSQSSAYSDFIPEGFASRAVFVALAFAVLPALTEEFLCRSVLLAEYEGIGMTGAILLSALFFSMLHLSPAAFPIYFFSGAVLGFTAFVTRSVFAAMLVHLANNLYILFLQGYTAKLIQTPQNVVFTVFVAAVIFLLALVLLFSQAEHILYRSGALNLDRDAPFLPENRSGSLRAALLSPTLLVCVAAYMVLIFAIA